MKKILGFSLHMNNTKVGIINQYGEVEQEFEIKNSSINFFENLKEKTIIWLENKGYDFYVDVERVSVAVPGIVNHETGIIVQSLQFGWNNYPLKDKLKKVFLPKPISILNNTNAWALGEFWVGAGIKSNSIIYYQLDEPISGALVLEGKLLLGEHNLGSSFDGLSFNKNSVLPLTNQLIQLIKEEIHNKNNSELYELFANYNINVKKLELDDLVAFKEKKVLFELLKPMMTKYFQAWLEKVAVLINVLDIKTLILSGQVCLLGQNFSKFIETELKKLLFAYYQSDLKVLISKRKPSTELIGSAYYAITDWDW